MNVYTEDAMTTPEIPPTTEPCLKTCIETTKAGKPCQSPVMHGEQTCFGHSAAGLEQRKRAALASVEARQSRVEARKEASEAALLSLTDAIRRDAAKERDALSASLITAAKADGNGAAMRELLNRVDGKVTDSLSLNAGNPFEMSEQALHAWLSESPTVDEPSVSTDESPNGHTERPNSSSKDPS